MPPSISESQAKTFIEDGKWVNDEIKLNIGCGSQWIDGYANFGIGSPFVLYRTEPGKGGDLYLESAYPLPVLKDDCASIIRCSHILEHFSHRDTQAVINEWVRVLKPGGVLKLAVPNFDYIVDNYKAQTPGLPLEMYLMGGHVDENDRHGAIFNESSLTRMMIEAGLTDIQHWESEIQDCASLLVSLNLQGRKLMDGEVATEPGVQKQAMEIDGWITLTKESLESQAFIFDEVEEYKGYKIASRYERDFGVLPYCAGITATDGSFIQSVTWTVTKEGSIRHARELIDSIHATRELVKHPDPRFADIDIPRGVIAPILTCPRLGFTAFMHCALGAFKKLNLDLEIQGGAFWHQGIEELCQHAIVCGAKYILTCDYDTVFDHRHIEALYGLMEARPDIGALFPVQMRREVMSALVTIRGDDGSNLSQVDRSRFNNDVIEAGTGHLGLTLIRADALKAVSKPWLHAVPAADGGWGEGHVDADIAFWRKFTEQGQKLYMANRVAVGHIETVINWPSVDLEPIIQHISDYYKDGQPPKGSGIWS